MTITDARCEMVASHENGEMIVWNMRRGLLTRLIDGLRGHSSRLDPYELAIVDAVADRLSADDGAKLRKRARDINMVQRLLGGQETNFYEKRGGKLLQPSDTAIAGLPRTARFARILVKSADPLSRLKATMYLVEGRLFSLEFDKPTKFADASRIEDIAVTILGPPFADPDAEQARAGDWPVEGDA